ncbi:aspartyl-tRNA(Asn)/glutamyl-tRNA(Gln) amidotransferase subunit A [Thermomonospora echinospora]|uniref:Aspartyl-tRNA(Asn)/glutamyl-tRNA(Gln) amidotransferase subunit A n=1 Tax=Thermomonospora echinospora TaxID=1992 RepID=A0A1H6BW58_9ACTN|nr:amidase [Thermomonospora echinospora]SEG64685.1 aspartyl-tRNA(Asn)/glutamyl-tRNA(Gln) amidotransferase subunit A [Thermomonospora echinospora]
MSRSMSRRLFLARSSAVTAATAATAGLTAAPVRATAPSLRMPNVPVRKEVLDDPTEATLAEAATLIRAGKLTSVELTEAYLARIRAYETAYQAFVTVLAEQALAAAKKADQRPGGPLSGIPLTVKDNFFTAGVRTTANSFIFDQFVPDHDATAVARLTAAGAIVLGKGQMGPLATTRATTPDGRITTVNAWAPTNPAVDPGGSSTGPATSVAARLAASSIGTQTGGSIVQPSNQQNLTGLKPTMGRASIYGIIPLSFTRDHPGPLARDAMDAAIMLSVMAGPDPRDPRTLGLPRVPDLIQAATPVRRGDEVRLRHRARIGVPTDYLSTSNTQVLALRRQFLATLEKIPGVRLVDVAYPADWGLLTGTFNDARLAERTEPFRPFLQKDLTLFGVSLLSWLGGLMLSGDEWITAQRAKTHLLREVLDGMLKDCDMVLQTGPVPFDILGLPEIGFPIGFNASGVPVGTILGGGPYEEEALLEVVAAYQAVTDWHWRRPADPPRTTVAARRAPARIDPVTAAETSA